MVHDCRYLYFHIICPGAVRRIVIIDDSSVHSDMTIYYRHGLRAATRIGPFLASFGLLSPSLLGSKAPVSIGPFHMTFPPRDLTVFVESLTNLDEKGERALEMYRSNWKFANERPSICEQNISRVTAFFSTFVFSVVPMSENGRVVTRDMMESCEIVEGDELFGKILAVACFNLMDLNGDGVVTLEEAIVGGMILMDAVIDQPPGNQAKLERLQDVSFRVLDAKSTSSNTLQKTYTAHIPFQVRIRLIFRIGDIGVLKCTKRTKDRETIFILTSIWMVKRLQLRR